LKEHIFENSGNYLFEIRLDSPKGQVIAKINAGDTLTDVKIVKGIHTIFLVFQQDMVLNNFRFLE